MVAGTNSLVAVDALDALDDVADEVRVVFYEAADELGAVVHDQVRPGLDGLVEVALEVLVRRVVRGVDPHPPLGEGGADVVLG